MGVAAAAPAGINDGLLEGRAGDRGVEDPDPALEPWTTDHVGEATSHNLGKAAPAGGPTESWGRSPPAQLGGPRKLR